MTRLDRHRGGDHPNFALAYAGLALSYSKLSGVFSDPREVLPKAKAAAMKALELDDTLAESHVSLGHARWQFDWDWSAAEKEFRRAIELNPGSAEAHYGYGRYLTSMGRDEEAIAEMKRARDLDRLSLRVYGGVLWTLLGARQYDQVIEQPRHGWILFARTRGSRNYSTK